MADTVKEIYNGKVQYGELADKTKTLFTTDAQTKYVIRDVQISGSTYGTAPELHINNMKVANLSGNLSGSEIVDANSTIALKDVGAAPTFFNIGSTISDNYASGGIFTELSNGAEVAPSLNTATIPNQGTTKAVNYLSQPATRWWFLNGDFYYYYFDSNSTTALYRRVGGPTGSEQQLSGNSYTPVAFDGVSKFYWYHSYGTFACYNTSTNTKTYISFGSANSGSTYPILVYCNGFLFYGEQYSGGNMKVLHIESGTFSNVGGDGASGNWSSNTYPLAFCNTDKKSIRIVFTSGTTSSNYYRDFLYNGPTMANAGYGTLASPSINAFCYSGFTVGDYAILGGSNQSNKSIYVMDRDFKVVSSKTTNATFLMNSSVSILSSPTTAQLNESGPSISLRITGVKTS